MSTSALLRMVDAVTVPVPDLDQGLRFYRDRLGHELLWRNDAIGQAALRLPESSTELVLTTGLDYAPTWLVASVEQAGDTFVAAGGGGVAAPGRTARGAGARGAGPHRRGSSSGRRRRLRECTRSARSVSRPLRHRS